MKRKIIKLNDSSHKQYYNKKKVTYCPFIYDLLQNKNNKHINAFIVQTILPYLEFNDKIQLRLVSKVFNDCVKLSLPFLQNKNFVTMNKYKILKSINEENVDNNSNTHVHLPRRSFSCNKLFSSEKKYSKKNLLVKLINNENYMNVRKQGLIKRIFTNVLHKES